MTLINTLLTALRGIGSNLLRTSLTTLGVIIGVASVMATLALGSDQVAVEQDLQLKNGDMQAVGETLTYEDGLGLPEAASLVDRAEMRVGGSAKLRYGRETVQLNFQGTDAGALLSVIAEGEVQPVGWPADQPLTPGAYIGKGRFFTDTEVLNGDAVCVLGYQTALDLFQGGDPIGETIRVDREPC